jgi:alpha-methylacyl-CoA racemase
MSTSSRQTQATQLPLEGLEVIELQAIGPVPFAGMILRSLGARVTRIISPVDAGLGVPIKSEFDLLNADKSLSTIDLKSAEGRATLKQSLVKADVLLEGFRPGVLERLGLAPATLMEEFPRLVIGRLSGWGAQGELSERAGHDINYLAMAGVLHAIGHRAQPEVPLNVVADFGGGAMHLLLGVMAKLISRSIKGKGGLAETSILAGTVGLTPMFYGMMAAGRWNTKRENNILDGALPFYRVYATKDDKHVAVGALENKFFRTLLKLVGLEASIDPTKQFSPETWPEMAKQLAEKFSQKTRDEWAIEANLVDACVSPVLDFLEAASHPHNLANEYYTQQPFAKPLQTIRFA